MKAIILFLILNGLLISSTINGANIKPAQQQQGQNQNNNNNKPPPPPPPGPQTKQPPATRQPPPPTKPRPTTSGNAITLDCDLVGDNSTSTGIKSGITTCLCGTSQVTVIQEKLCTSSSGPFQINTLLSGKICSALSSHNNIVTYYFLNNNGFFFTCDLPASNYHTDTFFTTFCIGSVCNY